MKLPKFLFQYVIKHQTSLGNNLAFPPEQDYPFDYKLLKKRMDEVDKNAKEMFGDNITPFEAQNILVQTLTECQKIEQPIQEQLIKICHNVINKLFSIPKETIELECKIVNRITPNKSLRILPEEYSDNEWVFRDLNEMSDVNKVVLKRRFINALVQGASYRYSQLSDLYLDDFAKLNANLPQLYKKIITLNDYLLFNKKEKISDKKPKQGAVVEVELGRKGEKTIITAQGTNFIFLLTETIRGFFELFASHGLPQDNKKAMYIISQADFLLAEPWDLRMGVSLWDSIASEIQNTKIVPYYFTNICELGVDDFNHIMQEVLAKTEKGKEYLQDIIKTSTKECEIFNIHSFIQDKNDNETIINDSYFTVDELSDEDDIIEEECFTEAELDSNGEDYLKKVLIETPYKDIDFREEEIDIPSIGQTNNHMWVLNVIANGIEIPTDLVYFRAENVDIDNESFYQLHIHVADELRNKGIAFKLYKAFINLFGRAVSLYNNRTATFYASANNSNNDDMAISKLWDKLANDKDINVTKLISSKGKEYGVIGTKK